MCVSVQVDAIEEVSAMLDFRPERFGHMCCLSEAAENRLMVRTPQHVLNSVWNTCFTADLNSHCDVHQWMRDRWPLRVRVFYSVCVCVCVCACVCLSTQELGVPVELCITSNIKTITFPSAEAHHFAKLYESKHPVVLCTDDSGVFGTSLSQARTCTHTHTHTHTHTQRERERWTGRETTHTHSRHAGCQGVCMCVFVCAAGVRYRHDNIQALRCAQHRQN